MDWSWLYQGKKAMPMDCTFIILMKINLKGNKLNQTENKLI